MPVDTAERNWAGNVTFSARRIVRPTSVEELQDAVASAPRVRAVGSRHSFSDIADSTVLVETTGLSTPTVIDASGRRVTVAAGIRYGELAVELDAAGLALDNLASLPHITVGGAIATATHGSGDRNTALSAAVAALDVVTADGELRHLGRGQPEFDGAVVSIGALGIVTAITLDVRSRFSLRQDMYRGLSWARLLGDFDAITSAGYSVSINPDWSGGRGGVIRVKSVETDVSDSLADATRTLDIPAVPGATDRSGVMGPWLDRLPHFGVAFAPSFGDEVQSEWLLDRRDAVTALDALRAIGDQLSPDILWSTEIRTIAQDTSWLSGAFGRETVGIHFTWRKSPRVWEAIGAVERVLEPFAPRPHWGKLSAMRGEHIRAAYPRFAEFLALRDRLDPTEAFTNPWFERLLR